MTSISKYLLLQLEGREGKVFKPSGYYNKEALINAAKSIDMVVLRHTAGGTQIEPLESLGVTLLLDCLGYGTLGQLREFIEAYDARSKE